MSEASETKDFKVGDEVWTIEHPDKDEVKDDRYSGIHEPCKPWQGVIAEITKLGKLSRIPIYKICAKSDGFPCGYDAGAGITLCNAEFWRTRGEAEDKWSSMMEAYVWVCETRLENARSTLEKGLAFDDGKDGRQEKGNPQEEEPDGPGM